MRRPPRLQATACVIASLAGGALFAPYAPAGAQTLPLKTEITGAVGAACLSNGLQAPPRSNATQREEASRLASAATQSAILGDLENARGQLERAAQLNPRSANIAYQLAGVLESVGEAQTAVEEYCRYLYLSPNATDAAEVEARIETLSPLSASRLSSDARNGFETGVRSFVAGDYDGSIAAFDQAILGEPAWAEAYYNRALARLRARDVGAGVQDLEQYLALAPDARDETAVAIAVVNLRNRMSRYTPSFAFMASQVFPGMGQFYLGRPVSGVLYASLGVGPVVWGFFHDTETQRRPYFWETVTIGLGVGFVAAIDAYISARRRNTRVEDLVRITTGGTTVGLRPPALVPSADGISLALLRLRF